MRTVSQGFFSDGHRLDGLLQLPDDEQDGSAWPTIVLCSGYQGLKEIIPAKLWEPFTSAGFACFAFDYRGTGTSDGDRGRMLPQEQVEDARSAISWLGQQSAVRPDAIGLLGWGFGGGIVVQAAADDRRVRAVACLNGVGDVGRAMRTVRDAEDWIAMQRRIAEDRVRRVRTGESCRVSPWDVVLIDPVTQIGVDAMYRNHVRFAENTITLQSAEAHYEFRPELVVDRISPRALLLVHGVENDLYPIEEAHALYARAREPKELIELPNAHHLDWIEPGHPLHTPTVQRIIDWFRLHLLASAQVSTACGEITAMFEDEQFTIG